MLHSHISPMYILGLQNVICLKHFRHVFSHYREFNWPSRKATGQLNSAPRVTCGTPPHVPSPGWPPREASGRSSQSASRIRIVCPSRGDQRRRTSGPDVPSGRGGWRSGCKFPSGQLEPDRGQRQVAVRRSLAVDGTADGQWDVADRFGHSTPCSLHLALGKERQEQGTGTRPKGRRRNLFETVQ